MTTRPLLDGFAPLTHLGLIRARGADSAVFLQSQLTNDIAGLAPDQARLAGFCSAKGRLQASFVVWSNGPDEFCLVGDAGVLPATLKRLSMFVLRARCKLDDASTERRLVGVAGPSAAPWLSSPTQPIAPWRVQAVDGGTALRLPDVDGVARVLLGLDGTAAVPTGPALALDAWRWLEVRSGVPQIEVGTVDRFVPQMINYELVGGVDFGKGCYPGQEVVARSQYRGTLKRRMFLFASDVPASAGTEVFHDADPSQPAGMVVNAAPRPDGAGAAALVEVKFAALGSGTLHLGSPEGAVLRRAALPYPVPIDAAAAA